ncbi:MAG: hypothetical protein HQ500_08465 [Flavobacteriales bacterium]|nr:hypothetical protein [Flavobacteriales bacterium]
MQSILSFSIDVLRFVHIAAGSIALLSGIIALGAFRKVKYHKRFGMAFFRAMVIVFITAVVLATYRGFEFLLCIAFLSFFSAYRGVRAMQMLKGGSIMWYDQAAAVSVLLTGGYMLYLSSLALQGESWSAVIVYGVFGVLSLFLAISSIREFNSVSSKDPYWFRVHRASMGGALIATMTAFSVTALDFLPDLIAWIGPSLVFSPMLAWIIRRSETPKAIA